MNDSNTDIIEMDPPAARRKGPRNKWEARLAEARARKGRWMMVTEPMTESTAAQISSDLRRSHARDIKKLRVSAVQEGDVWETTFGPHPHEPVAGEFHLWIRWMGTINEFAW